jgi:metal-sulfur cluster biosynthetic enzyme
VDEQGVRDSLRGVIDPELGVNIVDLGLVYEIAVRDNEVYVATTMTTPACPMHAYLTTQIEGVLWQRFPEMRDLDVELVWEPPWNPSMMSPELQRAMGRPG